MAPCPRCGNADIWYGENEPLHWIRSVLGTRKRFCPNCKSKWRVRSRFGSVPPSPANFVYFFILIAAGAIAYVFISESLEKQPYTSSSVGGGPSLSQNIASAVRIVKSTGSMGFGSSYTSSGGAKPGYASSGSPIAAAASAGGAKTGGGMASQMAALTGMSRTEMNKLKNQIRQNPAAMAALKANPKLVDEAKEKYRNAQ